MWCVSFLCKQFFVIKIPVFSFVALIAGYSTVCALVTNFILAKYDFAQEEHNLHKRNLFFIRCNIIRLVLYNSVISRYSASIVDNQIS